MIIIVHNLISILNKNTKLKVHVSKYVGKISGSKFAKICGSWYRNLQNCLLKQFNNYLFTVLAF